MSFWDIVNANRPVRIVRPEPQPVDEEADLANSLSIWANDPACTEWFLPWIEARIETHDQNEEAAIRSHPDLLKHKGQRMEAKAIRDAFLQWRGTSRKAPA